jgi:hypothetical protein
MLEFIKIPITHGDDTIPWSEKTNKELKKEIEKNNAEKDIIFNQKIKEFNASNEKKLRHLTDLSFHYQAELNARRKTVDIIKEFRITKMKTLYLFYGMVVRIGDKDIKKFFCEALELPLEIKIKSWATQSPDSEEIKKIFYKAIDTYSWDYIETIMIQVTTLQKEKGKYN